MTNWYQKQKGQRKKTSQREKVSSFFRKGDPFHPSKGRQREPFSEKDKIESSQEKKSSVFHFRDRTTMGDVFHVYAEYMADHLKREISDLDELDLEIRESPDLGFRFTEYSHDKKSIIFFFDVSFRLAPDYINLDIKGAKEDKNFSDTLRLFMSDSARQTTRRIASIVRMNR